jgi:ABC-type branched-subunit amino acid transport system substrate-binding protein
MKGRTGVIAALLALSAALTIVAASSATTNRAAAPTATAGADKALITCGRTRTIGVAAPITGLAASLGQQQLKWARYFVTRYNRSHRNKLRVVSGDTQLPDTAQAIQVAERFASNSQIL